MPPRAVLTLFSFNYCRISLIYACVCTGAYAHAREQVFQLFLRQVRKCAKRRLYTCWFVCACVLLSMSALLLMCVHVHLSVQAVPILDVRSSSKPDPLLDSVQLERAIIGSRSPSDLVYHRLLGTGSNGVVYEAGLSPQLQLHIPNVASMRFAAKFVYNYGIASIEVSVQMCMHVHIVHADAFAVLPAASAAAVRCWACTTNPVYSVHCPYCITQKAKRTSAAASVACRRRERLVRRRVGRGMQVDAS
jgi:hypothetical protein